MHVVLATATVYGILLSVITAPGLTSGDSPDAFENSPYKVCPLQFTPIGGSCYYFSRDKATWQDAFWKCASQESSLAMITRVEDDISLRSYLNTNKEGQFERWLGGIYDWKQALWKWGASGKIMKYRGFYTKQNSSPKFQWHCVATDPRKQNRWAAKKCLARKLYICRMNGRPLPESTGIASTEKNLINTEGVGFIRQRPKNATKKGDKKIYVCKDKMILIGKKCYTFSDTALTWHEAYWACRDNHTRPVVIKRRSENENIKKFLNRGFVEKQERWIGGMYDWKRKIWKWALPGTEIKYHDFTKERGKKADKWHCITMDPRYNNMWSSALCTERKYFMCQTKAQSVLKFGGKKSLSRKADAQIIIQLYQDQGLYNTTKGGSIIDAYIRAPKRRKQYLIAHNRS